MDKIALQNKSKLQQIQKQRIRIYQQYQAQQMKLAKIQQQQRMHMLMKQQTQKIMNQVRNGRIQDPKKQVMRIMNQNIRKMLFGQQKKMNLRKLFSGKKIQSTLTQRQKYVSQLLKRYSQYVDQSQMDLNFPFRQIANTKIRQLISLLSQQKYWQYNLGVLYAIKVIKQSKKYFSYIKSPNVLLYQCFIFDMEIQLKQQSKKQLLQIMLFSIKIKKTSQRLMFINNQILNKKEMLQQFFGAQDIKINQGVIFFRNQSQQLMKILQPYVSFFLGRQKVYNTMLDSLLKYLHMEVVRDYIGQNSFLQFKPSFSFKTHVVIQAIQQQQATSYKTFSFLSNIIQIRQIQQYVNQFQRQYLNVTQKQQYSIYLNGIIRGLRFIPLRLNNNQQQTIRWTNQLRIIQNRDQNNFKLKTLCQYIIQYAYGFQYQPQQYKSHALIHLKQISGKPINYQGDCVQAMRQKMIWQVQNQQQIYQQIKDIQKQCKKWIQYAKKCKIGYIGPKRSFLNPQTRIAVYHTNFFLGNSYTSHVQFYVVPQQKYQYMIQTKNQKLWSNWNPLDKVNIVNQFYCDIQCLAIQQQRQPLVCIATIDQQKQCFIDIGQNWQQFNLVLQKNPMNYQTTLIQQWMDYIQLRIQQNLQGRNVIDSKGNQIQYQFKIWAYNGFGYDYKYLTAYLCKNWGIGINLGQKNMPKCFIFNIYIGEYKVKICVHDCRTMITTKSLKQNAQKFNKIYFKQDFQISKIKTYNQYFLHRLIIKKYNLYDCYAMKQLLQNLYKQILNTVQLMCKKKKKRQIKMKQLKKRYTLPSIALFVIKNVFRQNQKIFVDKKHYNIHRNNYFGGMCQVFKHKHQGIIYQLDVNSLYPYVMHNYKLPLKCQYQIQDKQKVNKFVMDTNYKFYQCSLFKVQSFKVQWNCWIPILLQNRLVYPKQYYSVKQPQQQNYRWVWGSQLKQLLFQISQQKQSFIQISKVIVYSNQCNTNVQWQGIKQYIDILYNLRLQAKKDKNQLLDKVYKDLMNSLYGKFGQRQYSILQMSYQKNFVSLQAQDKVKYTQKIQQDQQQQGFHIGHLVRIASFISSTARCVTGKYIHLAGRNNCFYTDTDSLYVNQQGYFNLRKFIDQDKLGFLKLQRTLQRAFFVAKKAYLAKVTNKQWTMKSKGINRKQLSSIIQNGYKQCNQQYQYAIKIFQQCKTLNSLFPICRMDTKQFTKQNDGIIVHTMLKNLNWIFNRKPLKNYQTQPYTYQQLLELSRTKSIKKNYFEYEYQLRQFICKLQIRRQKLIL